MVCEFPYRRPACKLLYVSLPYLLPYLLTTFPVYGYTHLFQLEASIGGLLSQLFLQLIQSTLHRRVDVGDDDCPQLLELAVDGRAPAQTTLQLVQSLLVLLLHRRQSTSGHVTVSLPTAGSYRHGLFVFNKYGFGDEIRQDDWDDNEDVPMREWMDTNAM